MRTYGRITNEDGSKTWVEVTTDANGFDDNVYLTTLCQVFKLGLGESPFFGNYGIPAQQSIVTQVFPDFYAAVTQQQFAGYFAALAITREQGTNPPNYLASVTCHNGAVLTSGQVPQ